VACCRLPSASSTAFAACRPVRQGLRPFLCGLTTAGATRWYLVRWAQTGGLSRRKERRPAPGTRWHTEWVTADGPRGTPGRRGGRELKKISVTGGAPITLAPVERGRGATWGQDGTIIFAPAVFSGLLRIPAAGGPAEPLTKLDEAKGEKTHRWPQWLPDGRSVLFTVRSDASPDYEGASVEVLRVDTGERKVVHRGGYYARYVPAGHVLYVQNGTLFAPPLDLKRLELTGSQMPVLEDLETNPGEGSAQYGVSDNGLLTYLPRAEGLAPFTIATADREGRSQLLWKAPGIYGGPRLPGAHLVVARRAPPDVPAGRRRRAQRPVRGPRRRQGKARAAGEDAVRRVRGRLLARRPLGRLHVRRDGTTRGVRHLLPTGRRQVADLGRRRVAAEVEPGRPRAVLPHGRGRDVRPGRGGGVAGKPDLVFRGPFLGGIRGLLLLGFNFPDYDVSGDGRRFVVFTGGGAKRSVTRARVVLNWFDELRRLTSAGGR
jgi:hypothetical protein